MEKPAYTPDLWKSKGGPSGNVVLDGDGFSISYATAAGLIAVGCEPDDDSDETALIKGGRYWILNGDFRKECEALAPQGFDACKAFFDKQNNRSSWTTTGPGTLT